MNEIMAWQIKRLQNNLRGQANSIKEDRTKTKEQREKELVEINKLYKYISNYEEYTQLMDRLEDDGR